MLSQLSYAPERSSAGVASLATCDIISYPGAFVNTFFDFFRIFFEKENSRSKFRCADRNGVCSGACGVIKSGTGDPESEQKREGKQAPCPDAPVTAIFILSALC